MEQRSSDHQRIPFLDYARLFSIFGIALVNILAIAFSWYGGVWSATVYNWGDLIIRDAISVLFQGKVYGVFAFVFAVASSKFAFKVGTRGWDEQVLYNRRLIALAALGLLHGIFLFPGDILLAYAVCGFVLWRAGTLTDRQLYQVGAWLIVASMFLFGFLETFVESTDQELGDEWFALSSGTFFRVARVRFYQFLISDALLWIPFLLSIQGAMFLGLSAHRSGLLHTPKHLIWRRFRWGGLFGGIALTIVSHAMFWQGFDRIGILFWGLGAWFTCGGFIAWLIWLADRFPAPPVWVSQLGGATLSLYIGQSLVLSTIFSGYGFGLWEKKGVLFAVNTALLTTLTLCVLLLIWRRFYPRGPLEMLVARWVYRDKG